MLTFALFVASTALLAAGIALFQARSWGRRAERLAESYWELRYEIGQLRARVNRLEGAAGLSDAEPIVDAAAPPTKTTTTSFVPLSSLKK